MRTATILLVEDNPTDILLAEEAFKMVDIPHTLHVVKDGVEAIKFLAKLNGYAHAPRPDFIFLDLNLPRKSGHEVLRDIKAKEELKSIPVIILSTSDAPDDVEHAYRNHANCYMVKPTNYDHCIQALNNLLKFWSNLIKLPSA
ncbi:response regulator [Cerasicoccus fimbriatus]|uniref:response regulator n=1 Tax=Cerasicoccus fimbriatus TaxID=3014554 RepID=UPI0022B4BDB8|nr:response regulator [Cerasicoccus sp. TK19100]